MTRRIVLVTLVASAALAAGAFAVAFPSPPSVLAGYAIASGGDTRWELPKELGEVSGLATTPEGRVFAHGDERALLLELDVRGQRVVKTFAMGRNGVPGDFEGIAVVEGRFWLVTSDGILHESAEGENGGWVPFRTYDTGVGRQCEVEGLAHDPTSAALMIACKEPRVAALRNQVVVFKWSIARRALLPSGTLRLRSTALARVVGVSTFHPSGIERDSATGHWLLVAARERAVVELTSTGQLVAGAALVRRRHRQPEGIAIGSGRTLLVADEGGGRRGMLTVYRRAR